MNENDIYAAQNIYDAWDNGDRPAIRRKFARQEEITRMAREAGLIFPPRWVPELERFADLVAAAEREACAKACEDEIKRVKPIYSVVAENALKAIRARGQA